MLGELLVKRTGTVDPSKYPDEMFDLYSIPAYDRGVPDLIAGCEIGSAKQVVQPGDVLLSRIVPHIRRAWVVGSEDGRRIIASGEWMVFRSQDIYPRWLRHMFLGDRFHQQFMATVAGVGGSLMRARPSHVANIEIPFPSHPEQRRIAAILDHADALRDKRRRVIGHFDELTQSTFIEMFGDPMADSIHKCPLGAVGDVITGNTPSRANPLNFGDGIEWIKSDNLGGTIATAAEERLSATGRQTARVVPGGSVLVACIAGSPSSIGKASLVDREVAFNQQINAVVPGSTIDSRFLLEQLKVAPELVRQQSTGGMKGLVSKSNFASIRVMVPPLDHQRRFANFVAEVDDVREREAAALTVTDNLFESLRSRAFSGQL
ncbi:restriction endonuclease subunit S [Mycobacterium talmoniae]|uniref:Type I restriction modification DNA specificity domain-containing protein n=1 Tax=Mycobacterium talmoniae TaxID=1858794 RepID=A0A1S1NQJ7_9MYCO|nr:MULTISPECIES: restriction endonuclease subunit S [Mycobacterium]OHV05117.1 hypothetical protein BKN37_07000 [Mycobacterium talmoniae]PQM45614.1 hypothetical protein C1Y40_04205 [Mycobacterium talmoniae]TDH49129.1 hypothetical protein E2F47_21425 [Mycobacterium eburneum]